MRTFLALAAVVSTTLLSACDGGKPAQGAANTGDILIGHVASLNGARADFGTKADKGAQLAIEELNAAGGVLGRKLVLKTEDDQSQPGEPGTAAKKLIHSDHVVALLGEVASSASLEMGPVAQSAGIPMISPASTDEKVTQEGDYVFRACFLNAFQGEVMSRFALEKGWKKVAIFTESTSDYSMSLTKAFKKTFAQQGGTVVIERTYSTGDTDFSGAISALKSGDPDAIFMPGYYGEVAIVVKQARQAGLNVPFLGGDGWTSESLIPNAGKAIEGCFFCDHLVSDAFKAKYKAKYGAEADSMAALGYDAAGLLADAIKRAGSTDGAKVRDALAATKDYPGVSGNITLDKNRNASKPAAIITIQDGKFVRVTEIKP